ncbi:MAG: hypothetical protein KBD37_08805 [Burkholderiales bacterium]|nr:hypothetical protein [Burkholderiales bacterium]
MTKSGGGVEHLESHGYKVHSIMSLPAIIDILYQGHKITLADKQQAELFL